MIHRIAQYRVRRDRVEEIEQAVRKFVDAIGRNESRSRYDAFQADDSVSFIHVMSFPDEGVEAKHRTAEQPMRFVEALTSNCEEEPVFTTVKLIKSTREE